MLSGGGIVRAVVRTATPHLYVSLVCYVVPLVMMAGEWTGPLGSQLLKSKAMNLCSRGLDSLGMGPKSRKGSFVWFDWLTLIRKVQWFRVIFVNLRTNSILKDGPSKWLKYQWWMCLSCKWLDCSVCVRGGGGGGGVDSEGLDVYGRNMCIMWKENAMRLCSR